MNIEDLYELIRKEDVCLFIGAGFSLYAGYPSGDKLKDIILNTLTPDERKKVSEHSQLSKIAQDFVTLRKGNKGELISLLKTEFFKKPIDTINHDILSRISFFKTIITTNYDTLIEDSYTNKAVVISKPIDLNISKSNKVKIYKIHGDIKDSNNLVITDKDYSNLYGVDYRNPFWASIISELSSKHVVFLGYGYEDLNIWSIFEKILEHTNGQGKRRFFISPSITDIKKEFLNQNDIVFYKLTGRVFLDGLLDNIKKNLKNDVENKSISVQTALDVFSAHNLEIELDASIEKNWIKNIKKVNGETVGQIEFQISDKKAIEKYNKFINGNSGIELTFRQKDLTNFSYLIEGFNFINFENLSKFTVQVPPVFSQTCTIQFIEDNFEIENISYDVYNSGSSKLLVKTKIESFDVNVYIDYSEQPKMNLKVNINEPKQLASISSALRVYTLAYLIFSGKRFNVYFNKSGNLLNKSMQGKGDIANDSYEKLRFYKALKQIELYFNIKFQDIKTSDLNKYVTEINNIISLIETKRINIDEGDGVCFRAKEQSIELIRTLKSKIKDKRGTLSWHQEKQFIDILGQNLELGITQVIIEQPYIDKETDSFVRIRSKNGKITLMYEKFGLRDIDNSKIIW